MNSHISLSVPKKALPHFSVVSVMLAGALIGAFAGSSNFQITYREVYVFLLVLFALLSVYFIRYWSVSAHQGRFDPFELPVLFTFAVFAQLGVLGGFALWNPEDWLLFDILRDNGYLMVTALFFVFAGIVSLWFGYLAGRVMILRGVRHKKKQQTTRIAIVERVLMLYALTLFARFVHIEILGAWGPVPEVVVQQILPFQQWMFYMGEATYLVFAIIALETYRGRWPSWLLYTLLAIDLMYTFISGSITPVVWLFGILVAAYFYTRGRIPWRFFVVLLVIVVLMVPGYLLYRQGISAGVFETRSLPDAAYAVVQTYQQAWTSQSIGESLDQVTEKVIVRQSDLIQNVAMIIYKTPSEIPFAPIEEYLMLPLYPIPRVIWPDKPVFRGGGEFAIEYLEAPITTHSSAHKTPFGDLYMHMGFPGIIIGMFFMGIIYRLLYRALRYRKDMAMTALYLSLLFYVINWENDIQGFVQGLIQRGIVFYILTLLVYKRMSLVMDSSGKASCISGGRKR